MNMFWIDTDLEDNISFDDFYRDVVKEGMNNIFVQYNCPYKVFLNIVRNFLNGKKNILLDSDVSANELIGLDLDKDIVSNGSYFQDDISETFEDFSSILKYLKHHKENLSIDIFTSGTTGRPKKISQDFTNVIRQVKIRDEFQSNVWAFAYNPTHFAGLQVFFQAFFNRNTIVYVFNKPLQLVFKQFNAFNITHMSCTPTYMKLLLPCIQYKMDKVKSLTFGGERFDSKNLNQITQAFPNAKIRNVYASTEAGSILKSNGEYFSIPSRLKKFLKIEDNELLIHKNLLGDASTLILKEDWYHTGDLVNHVDDSNFVFQNRKSEMINVGGYKVNPTEVSEVLNRVEGVVDSLVFGKDNSIMGKVIVAHVIIDDNSIKAEMKSRINTFASKHLQEFKRPRLIKIVDSFELTRTGKIKTI